MKLSKLLPTHLAVFAVGFAIAMGVRSGGPSDDDTRNAGAAGATAGGSARGVAGASDTLASDPGASGSGGRAKRGTGVVKTASAKPAGERLAEIVRIADPLERQSALVDLLDRLGPQEFAAFADQFRGLDHFGNGRGEYEIILRAWAKADPLGALEHAGQRPDGQGDQGVVLAAWAVTDSTAATRWAMDHHTGDGANPYLSAVIRGLAATDVGAASELAATMPRSRERGEAMDAITRALFVQGMDAAMGFPSSIADPDLRVGYVGMIADRLAAKDPATAATWLAGLGDADAQNRGARRVAEALARTDVTQAASWVSKLQPEARAEAARGVVQPMSGSDIAGTAKWVSTLSGIPNYDRVVEEFVWSCDQRDPEQSAAWIKGMADEAQRTRLYHRMLGEWARRDAAAVKQWVATNPVPGSVAQRFK